MTEFDREIIAEFVQEVSGYLPVIRDGLVAFQKNVAEGSPHSDDSVLTEAHRGVHTIKGASGMVGLAELSQIAFHLEEILDRLLHEPDTSTPELLAGMHVAVGHIEKYIVGVSSGDSQQPDLTAEALQHLCQLRGLPTDDSLPTAAALPAVAAPSFLRSPFEDFALPEAPPANWLSDNFNPLESWDANEPVEETALPVAPSWLSDHFNPSESWNAKEPIEEIEIEVAPRSTLTVADDSSEVPAELLEVFRLEADDHIRLLTTLLPEARNDPANLDRWQTIRRSIHTLKGAAGLVGFHSVTRLTHRMEDLLDQYYDQKRTATVGEIDLLLAASDAIAETLEGRANTAVFSELHSRLERILDVQARLPTEAFEPDPLAVVVEEVVPVAAFQPAREADATVRVPIARLNDIAKLVGELVIARTSLEQRVGELNRLLSEARPSADRLKRVSGRLDIGYEASAMSSSRSTTSAAYAFAGAGGGGGDDFDELEFDRYTEFHLLTRELSETTTDVQTVFGEFGNLVGELEGQLTRQARLASEVEDKLMRLRMVPFGTIATKLQRTVRTAAVAANKNAEFVLDGDQTGLDKAVLEAMADPLLHLLRNAVDHGLEAEAVRLALGKPAHGTITLKAAHEGSHVVLTLADDGRGIDFDRIRAAVVRRGLAPTFEADQLTEEELADFLFRPGFSTREEVSELSGRGVGLDVVKTKVEGLNGTVVTTSVLGRGTTFTIRLPMTLAVIRALLVRVSGQTFAIPLEAVEQILRPSAEQVEHIGRSPVLRVNGLVCPLVPLSSVLRIRHSDVPAEARQPVIVLRSAGRRIAVLVDQLMGGREVVIKSLGRHLHRVPAVSGATLLGDGSVVLILNPTELLRSAGTSFTTQPIAPARAKQSMTALVVDDSPSVRRVLSMVLTNAGWNVVTAKDGLEALEILQTAGDQPDIVLTDVEMPRMDGYELLATVRSQPTLAHLPVVVITSRSADKHRRKALDLGASAYVVKPFQDVNLLEILQQLVRPMREAKS